MGYAMHVVEEIGAPFLVAHETTVLIPPRGWQETVNRSRKLVFILHGESRHRLRGLSPARYLGGVAEVSIAAGDILVIPYDCRHDYVAPVPGEASRLQAFRLAFDLAHVPPLALPSGSAADEAAEPEGDPETSAGAFARQAFREFRHLPGGQDAAIREALARIREEAQGRLPGYRLRVRGLCLELMTLVARRMAAESARAGSKGEADGRRTYLVAVAKDFLLRSLDHPGDQPLRLADVAAHVGVSEQHLARVFKHETGRTVFEYARRARFERAKTLLSGSDRNVSEIALLTGFSSVAVFSRTFRREIGRTPSEYRRFIVGEQH
ncbi:MAG TPA: helix-turn-helix transcriptional regulator [Armatimonadaceae bacterium]|nr:helix-turn-helix transcriptional regulator [Armatimonadaceae bacterium]